MIHNEQFLDHVRSAHKAVKVRSGQHPQDAAQILMAVPHLEGIAAQCRDTPTRVVGGQDGQLAVQREAGAAPAGRCVAEDDLRFLDPHIGDTVKDADGKEGLQIELIVSYQVFGRHREFSILA